MSISSSKLAQQGKPTWLNLFLRRTFFNSCSIHRLSKNELNNYCITCDLPVCRYCVSSGSHDEHKLLKIYRHVYKDVVPLCDMEKHIDCSKIQPYKCNKQWVVSINPLPHNGSGFQAEGEAACDVCKRILNDPIIYRYCCLSCKAEAFTSKMTYSEHPFFSITTPRGENVKGNQVHKEGETKKASKRKWTPYRSPMF